MTYHARAFLFSGLAAMSLVFPQEIRADGFTGQDFLKWGKAGQDSYISISITMAGIIASQTNPSTATCIDDWYFRSKAVQAQRDDEIRKTIRENPTYNPSGVIYAWLKKRCGAFK